jgi:hypothetical protein
LGEFGECGIWNFAVKWENAEGKGNLEKDGRKREHGLA